MFGILVMGRFYSNMASSSHVSATPNLITVLCLLIATTMADPILTPLQMQQKMGLGINLGNTLDAPFEGNWAPAAKESFFDEYKARGFTNVRVPVQWGHHISESAPYAVNETFMTRVEQVVDWSLDRGLVTILNTHHDEWFEDDFKNELPRFKALWTQISNRFSNRSQYLLFEIYNEPHATQFTANDLNAMNEAVLPIIRSHNANRIVIFGGLKFMNPSWIVTNPDALHFPTNDTQLMLEIHSYDPYDYAGGKNPTVHSWGYVYCFLFFVLCFLFFVFCFLFFVFCGSSRSRHIVLSSHSHTHTRSL